MKDGVLRWLRFSLVTQVSTLEEGAFDRSREMKKRETAVLLMGGEMRLR